jgi:hypothetical protein
VGQPFRLPPAFQPELRAPPYGICDNANVIQYRRLSALILGAWLGASILTDVAVTQNFQTVDRFLAAPGDPGTSDQIHQIGRPVMRSILRRNAAEENNWIFLNWERVELALAGGLFLLFLFADRPHKLALGITGLMLWIVFGEHFLLTPRITALGRIIDYLPPTDPDYKTFWIFHALYSGLDILKMLAGFVLGVRLTVRRRPDREQFAREYAALMPRKGAAAESAALREPILPAGNNMQGNK